jgi:hypothetical protein
LAGTEVSLLRWQGAAFPYIQADAAGEQGKAPAEVNPLEPFDVQAANEAYMRREAYMRDRVDAMVWEAAH